MTAMSQRVEGQKVKLGPLESDTIAAIATAPGRGALGIVRLSGRAAVPICESIFRGKQSIAEAGDRTAIVGEVARRDGTALDQVMVLAMRGPHTATGEDVVEITCHGGMLVPRLIMRRLTEEGARPAEPGEFTKRAFLNGKMDLAQAEAVEEIVRAASEKALEVAMRQLKGELSRSLEGLEQGLMEWLTLIEANIDFVEDEIDAVDNSALAEALEAADGRLEDLLTAHEQGKYLRDGLDVAIVGKPNVGKSSLFNRLVGHDRAIVSDTPGTTRDVVDGLVGVDGVVLSLHDTAGVRLPADGIEAEAVRRTKQTIADADIALVVLDASTGLGAEDRDILSEAALKPRVVVANKADLPRAETPPSFWDEAGWPAGQRQPGIRISALTGLGVPELVERLGDVAREMVGNLNYEIIVNERHARALREALGSVRRALASVRENVPLEFIASDIRFALDCLGDVTGKRVTSGVLDEIFSRFCIGK
jgi:tRNA modification GTPase